MGLGRFLLLAMAPGPFVVGHPTAADLALGELGVESDVPERAVIVETPVEVVQEVAFVDDDEDGEHVETAIVVSTITTTIVDTQTATPTPDAGPEGGLAAKPQSHSQAPASRPPAKAPQHHKAAASVPATPPDAQSADDSAEGTPQAPDSKLFGISYAPYDADKQCKTQDAIDKDFDRFGNAYSLVRIYGTSCNQVPMVLAAAKAHKMKVFLGIWEPANVLEEAKDIVDGVHGDWEMVHTVSVGNELVNSQQASAGDMAKAVAKARSYLRDAGYKGPVVTVDTFKAYLENRQLGEASDYCAINAHAFFDSSISAHQSGKWLQSTFNDVQERGCPKGKKVIVTETGWPNAGDENGNAVPGREQQRLALGSIREMFAENPGAVILFSSNDDAWKKPSAATFNTEQHWGIIEHDAQA